MMPLTFSSKAGTLALLKEYLNSACIMPLVCINVADWLSNRQHCLARIWTTLGDQLKIVRSSSQREDKSSASNAGVFLSVLNVTTADLEAAIENVIASYGVATGDDEVLIQPMLQNVVRSGVAFSHDPNTCSPYRVINWHEGDDTTKVTSGQGGRIWQGAAQSPIVQPMELQGVLALLDELLNLFGQVPIDCEFGVTSKDDHEILWLFQVRPLIMPTPSESAEAQAHRLSLIAEKIECNMRPHPFLMGRRTVYGVMPDWNPAEIIGIRPKPLALSLYRDLITDAIWAYQRNNYGYRNLRSFPLMPHFFGQPYIDVRLSFNSFIPADLADDLAGRLVDYYIERLLSEPTLHDKVEFEIVFSCYTLDLPQRLKRLSEAGFSSVEQKTIADSLRRLTNRIVHSSEGLWQADAAKLEVLIARRETLLASNAAPLERIYWLLEDAKRYGTLPFAGLARAGFIAVQILRSLVSTSVFSQANYDEFMLSISTVSGQLARDRSILNQSSFLSRYGHLRPGTYDILSPRYDEASDFYFNWNQRPPEPEQPKAFALTLQQMREIATLLKNHDLQPDVVGLFDFLQASIELRELSKFHFTRNLSDALSLAADLSEQFGISREDLAYCNISAFQELHIAGANPHDILSRSIEQGKARYQETLRLALPPLIACPGDVWGFEWPETAPNFITQKQITAAVSSSDAREHLAGVIVCIPSADPGFDWLFSYPIAGLITTWGGANSHMAIRASELGLPAVIGAGEILFRRWSQAKYLHLDCAGRRVEILA
jgi:hypothetical protein